MKNLFEPTKLALVRILQILEQYSDFDHPLKQQDIIDYLDKDYGISIERKAVGRNLSLLWRAAISPPSIPKNSSSGFVRSPTGISVRTSKISGR